MKKIILITATLVSLGTGNVYAQGYVPLEPLPCIPGGGVTCSTPVSTFTFANYMQYTFNLFIAISASVAVFMIVYGGFKYMTTDSWSGKNEGLEKVKGALLGLLLVLTSYIILRTVDPRLVAIRSDLVKPLDIDYSQYQSTMSILSQIENTSNNYLEASQLTRDEIAKARTTLDTDKQVVSAKSAAALAALKDAAQLYPDAFGDDIPSADNLDWYCKNIAQETDAELSNTPALSACIDYVGAVATASADQKDIYVNIAKQGIDNQLGNCLKQTPIDTAGCTVSINQYVQNQRDNLVKNLNSDPAPVVDYGTYAKGVLAITFLEKNWMDKKQTLTAADYGNIATTVDTYLAQIQTNSIKDRLNKSAAQIITDLGGDPMQLDSYRAAYQSMIKKYSKPNPYAPG